MASNYKSLRKNYLQGPDKLMTGNKVYNGGSNSPHAGGGLDKAGYINRDKKAKQKRKFLEKRLKSGGF